MPEELSVNNTEDMPVTAAAEPAAGNMDSESTTAGPMFDDGEPKSAEQDQTDDKESTGNTGDRRQKAAEMGQPVRRKWFVRFLLCCVSFGLVCVLIGIAYAALGMEPFGYKTVAVDDAKIQYIDFFTYYVDVLRGTRSLTYDFSNMMGGSTFGLFSYYLASPFNFLLYFFGKEGVYRFFNIAVALKLATAGATFCWYLQRRFADRIRPVFVVVLSMGYALMQYSVAQSSNIMWLDGLYMMPLIMLGVYEVLRKRTVWRLVLAVGFCILCNWYIAGVTCLFSGIWFFFEFFMLDLEECGDAAWVAARRRKGNAGYGRKQTPGFLLRVTDFVVSFCRYVWGMGLGVALSAAIFLPAVAAMRQGKGQYDDLKILFDISGDLLSSVRGYVIGTESARGHAALFCGGAALVCAAAFFFSASVKIRHKIAFAGLAGVCFLMLHWEPAMLAFSLMKRADSYWYRYSYLIIFSMLFGAAAYLSRAEQDRWTRLALPVMALLYALAVCKLNGIHLADLRAQGMQIVFMHKAVFATAAAAVAASVLVLILVSVKKAGAGRAVRLIAGLLLIAVTGAELTTNAYLIWKLHTDDTQPFYMEYSAGIQKQLAQLRAVDGGYYRIAQDRTRWHYDDDDMTSYFNDSLAQNYWSNTAYTSSPERAQLDLMWKLGYRDEAGCILIVRDPMLAADSFLGVKYLLESTPVAGLEPVEGVEPFNGRTVYRNPFALPMAFVYDGEHLPTMRYDNAYVYQNELYSTLSGRETEVFKPLTWTRDNEGNKSFFRVFVPEGNWLAYGNLLWPEKFDGLMSINGTEPFGYACWTSPASFLIRSRGEQAKSESGNSLQEIQKREKEAAKAAAARTEAANAAGETGPAAGDGKAAAGTQTAAAEPVKSEMELRKEDLLQAAQAFDTQAQGLVEGSGFADVRTVVFQTQKGLTFKDYQFFGLDLDALREVSDRIRSTEVTDLTMENGHVACRVSGRRGQSVCLLVPWSRGWQVTRNGETVQADMVAGTMITIPLVDGENRIELNYTIPFVREGMVISAAALIVLLIDIVCRWISARRRRRKAA